MESIDKINADIETEVPKEEKQDIVTLDIVEQTLAKLTESFTSAITEVVSMVGALKQSEETETKTETETETTEESEETEE